ncbi:1-deoxy-D-xylulose-5-phosphate synthase [Candidatus Cryosericum terrychapinii]|uniref:1-deoxy-D-xylulose-5-phosphate synthase n=1 Tax=Candidatus Cryosericum terrychapinii TaxID=2290919 RepID=A0A398CYJ3_9BACT|nr:1-deoxy-D-xylulose-5-phosphate synthase [Candidatus Cryosericum terrychapinii]RIE06329.1 1-deoxy-D-xylulose-5-phosphate synthase [Candidatus Cryosericum terrychapinii]
MILEHVSSPADIRGLDIPQLRTLAAECRQVILDTCSTNGGHLASNLGVVELTIALHMTLDTPTDQLVWDVGHQCYTHKLLTGRYKSFRTLRQCGGIGGFVNPNESPYDTFLAGHASTSLSIATGLVAARRLDGGNQRVVAVIGDGALSGGMALEALNNLGRAHGQCLVILNHNDMSISRSVGGMARALNRLRTRAWYLRARESPLVGRGLLWLRTLVKRLYLPTIFFEELGFRYFGVVDGHDIGKLIEAIDMVKDIQQPVVLQVLTVKGKGYELAERQPAYFHGVAPFLIENGLSKQEKSIATYSDVFGETLIRLAETDPRIVAITAAMMDGTGLAEFARRFPERCYDVGIAEQHAVGMAASLASRGYKPYVAVYSTFLQRAYDQIVHDVGIGGLPVRFAVDRAGLVSDDGPTHQGVFDVGFLKSVPGMTVCSPGDRADLVRMLELSAAAKGPFAIRYPKDAAYDLSEQLGERPPIVPGTGVMVADGRDVAIVSLGPVLRSALEARKILAGDGVQACVADLRFAQPLDTGLLTRLAGTCRAVLLAEETTRSTGVYDAVVGALVRSGMNISCIGRCGVPDAFPVQDKRAHLLSTYQLDAEGLACAAHALLAGADRR